jgi:hypothetical protein
VSLFKVMLAIKTDPIVDRSVNESKLLKWFTLMISPLTVPSVDLICNSRIIVRRTGFMGSRLWSGADWKYEWFTSRLVQCWLQVKWSHFGVSERALHKMPDIWWSKEQIEINIEVPVLSVVWGKECWSEPELAKDSMTWSLSDQSSTKHVNKMRISLDAIRNPTGLLLYLVEGSGLT